jgi:hypothetical protein
LRGASPTTPDIKTAISQQYKSDLTIRQPETLPNFCALRGALHARSAFKVAQFGSSGNSNFAAVAAG